MGEQRVPHYRKSLLNSNEALYDGVRPWMNNSVRKWVGHRFYRKVADSRYYSNKLIHKVELHSRLNFGRNPDDLALYRGVFAVFNSDESYALDIVQAIVELCTITPTPKVYDEMSLSVSAIQELNEIFISGGSKWHIVLDGDRARMEARVNQTTTTAYQQLINSQEDYAPLLKSAWEYCFGRSPNPSEAYTYSIRAVEAVSWRIISPNNKKATLGTLLKAMDSESQSGKISTQFNDKSDEETTKMITYMMSRLWSSQTDRHATGDFVKPTQLEAESAIHIAIALCQLFNSGMVIRRTQ